MPGCRAADRSTDGAQVQWPTTAAAPLQPSDPRLWVALAARLGTQASTAPLELRSAAGPMILRDASGRSWRAPLFSLRWLSQPLTEPLVLRRLVAGPYASFESAEHAAQNWRRLGVAVRIAQPADWEVWAPARSPIPPGLAVREWRQTITAAVVPALVQPGRPLQSLQGPVLLEAPAGLRWQDGVYAGPFRLQRDAYGTWTLIEQVPLERYLEGVVPHEIGAAAPPEALAVQAVLARTWALSNLHRYRVDGYHLCATTQCQVYSDPRQASPAVRSAIGRSLGQLLSWHGLPIHAVYHASNGGVGAGLEEAWDALPQPYLRAAVDRRGSTAAPLGQAKAGAVAAMLMQQRDWVGSDHPLFRWSRVYDAQQIAAALAQRGDRLGQVERVAVVERGASGRVLALAVEGSTGRQVLRLDAIRRTLRRLPSTLFELRPVAAGIWRFDGGGFGHGVGLSQAGAIDLAARGWSYPRILERYYPGTQLQTLQQVSGSALNSEP